MHGHKPLHRANKPGAINRFLKRHYKILIGISGIVISLTLSVRDKLQERVRDFESSVQNAENLSQLEAMENDNKTAIRRLNIAVNQSLSAVRTNKSSEPPEIPMLVHGQLAEDAMQDVQRSMGDVSRLLTILGGDRRLQEQLNTLGDRFASILHDVADGHITPERLISGVTQLSNLGRDADVIKRQAMRELEEKKLALEQQFQYAAWLSYGLLWIAVAVSMTGHVIGKDGELPDIKL